MCKSTENRMREELEEVGIVLTKPVELDLMTKMVSLFKKNRPGNKKIQRPNNFDACYKKYIFPDRTSRATMYRLVDFQTETNLRRSTLLKFIREKKDEDKKEGQKS